MKYRELLEMYRQNKLNQEQMQQVESDIEKQESSPATSVDFVKTVNRSIRRAFMKMGIVVTMITIMVILFVILVLPRAVDQFYYDPGEIVGEEGNRISLDLAVYTELCMPGCVRDTVTVDDRGYGVYDILIHQNVSYNRHFTNLSGRIEKGNLTLYVNNVLTRPTGNAFAWFQMEGDSADSLTDLIEVQGKGNYCAAGNVEQANETLEALNENEKYVAYVSLDKMMPYEEFMTFLENTQAAADMGNIWCAVCTENGVEDVEYMFRAENLGFQCDLSSSHRLDWDREQYPNLVLWDEISIRNWETAQTFHDGTKELRENMKKEDFMKTHFISMLRYLSEQKDFLAMMNETSAVYRRAADYVEEHGIMVYGFAGIGDKESILALNENAAVYEIYVNELP